MRRWLVVILGVVSALALARCAPRGAGDAGRGPRVALEEVAIHEQSSTLWVVLAWHLGPSDGLGPIDSVVTTAATNAAGSPTLRHALAGTAVVDSFAFTKPAPGSTTDGWACAQSKRRGLLSAAACKPWAYTTPDQPPPPPVLDSTRVVGLRLWPDPAKVRASARVQFCAFATFADGRVGRDQKPVGHPGAAYCDSVGRALYGAQYAGRIVRPATLARLP